MVRNASKNIDEILVALLHDIGKLAVRAKLENNVWQASKSAVSILGSELEALLDKFKSELESPNSKTAIAHGIAGFNDSDEAERENSDYAPYVRLKNPFSNLQLYNLLEPSELFQNYKPALSFFPIAQLEECPNISKFEYDEPNGTAIYQSLWNSLISDIEQLRERGRVNVESALRLMERYCSFVPAWVSDPRIGGESLCDISLYQHVKLTAAALAALKSAKSVGKPLSLIVGKITGFKKFCLALSGGAELEDLWGRYMYALILAKSSAMSIVNKLDLSVANILLDNGLEFALLSAAKKKNVEIASSFEKELNRWLFENKIPLSLRFSIVDFSVDEALSRFGAIWQGATNNLPSIGRVDVKMDDFEPHSFKNACAICSDELEAGCESGICNFCNSIKRISRLAAKGEKISASDLILHKDVVGILDNGNFVLDSLKAANLVEGAIPISGFAYALKFDEISDVVRDLVNGIYSGKLKVKDESLPPLVAFAGEAAGKGRVAALVIGIDNRDCLFDERVSERPISLPKICVILNFYRTFLNHYSKWVAASFEEDLGGIHPTRFGPKGKRRLIGMLWPDVGLVAIGSWSDVLEFGLDVRRVYRAFVGEGLYINQFGLSAGFFDAEPRIGWKYLLLKADELYRCAVDPERARFFLKQELSERPSPPKVCDSVVVFQRSGSPVLKGVARTRISWSEFEGGVLPIVAQWRRAALINRGFSKPLLTQLWSMLNIWRSDRMSAFVELERMVGIHKRGAAGELIKLLDMIYSFTLKNMDMLHIPLGWVERLDLGG